MSKLALCFGAPNVNYNEGINEILGPNPRFRSLWQFDLPVPAVQNILCYNGLGNCYFSVK